MKPSLLAAWASSSTWSANAGSLRSLVHWRQVQARHLLGEPLEVAFGHVAAVLFSLLVVEGLDEVPHLVLLARGQRGDLLGLEDFRFARGGLAGSRYSIFSLPVRTHFWMIDGSAPSVNSLQIGHSRSPKYCERHGRGRAAERVAALRDAGDQRLVDLRDLALLFGSCCRALVCRCSPPPVAISDHHDRHDDDRDDDPELRQAFARTRADASASSSALRCSRACSRRCLRVRSSSSLSAGAHGPTFTRFGSSA